MLFGQCILGLSPEAIKDLVGTLAAQGKTTEEIITEAITQNNQAATRSINKSLQTFAHNIEDLEKRINQLKK